ncbi:MAG: methylamine utilization protein [Rhizomicrobium sp.]|jgi:plastocyanin
MDRPIFPAAVVAAVLACSPALGATVELSVVGTDGRPAESAVVELSPVDPAAQLPPTHVSAEGIIDQRDEMFMPLVTVIRKGGHVVFTNNDTTMHQVYSFSSIKQFEFEIDEGQRSVPVVFDQPGVAAIGCNIHDQMITYVYVAATPWVALTDAGGHARIDAPPGAYRATIWDPQSVPGRAPPPQTVDVAASGAKLTIAIPLLAGDMPGKKHMHMQSY